MADDKLPKSVDEILSMTKETIASGQLSDEELADLEARCQQLEEMPPEERDSINFFLRHMPNRDSDLTLVVLKGQLLIEQKIREFISERMLAPVALNDARLSAYQATCLGEALTLPNEEPRRLWSVLRKLNKLRNKLAHNLDPLGINERVEEIVAEYSAAWPIQSGFVGVLASAYGQVSELCRLARDSSFQVKGRRRTQ
jgi:hypothetical protein